MATGLNVAMGCFVAPEPPKRKRAVGRSGVGAEIFSLLRSLLTFLRYDKSMEIMEEITTEQVATQRLRTPNEAPTTQIGSVPT
eukprot:649618-Pleurochrysis_carterae.AAC.2